MIRFTRISRVFWISGFAISAMMLSGCQNRAPSLRMLDVRAGYDNVAEDEEVALYQRGKFNDGSVARRSAPRVSRVWIYPHELPSKDYFWGGYVSLIVSEDSWVFDGEAQEDVPAIEAMDDQTATK